MSAPGQIAGDQLRSYVERIEHVEEEIRGLTDDKKDIYAEAKANGFDVKILREVVRIRKEDQKEREQQQSLLDVYLHALDKSSPAKKAACCAGKTSRASNAGAPLSAQWTAGVRPPAAIVAETAAMRNGEITTSPCP